MKKTSRRAAVIQLPRKVVTTLGDLISAAYEAADGFGTQKMERAALLLSSSPLARRMNRQLRFVR
ncbi:MAG TPA: hypothetical protein VFP65_27095 [Anaeromyxobacteraceae bacterium]|jgi:hypothetical protein|nr:hypothetical protein [Anaeromyxobacteraceae bacterium]